MRLSREATLGRQCLGTFLLLIAATLSLIGISHSEGFFVALGDSAASVLGLWVAVTVVFVTPAVAAFETSRKVSREERERLLFRASFVPLTGYLAYRRYISRLDGGGP